MKSRKWTAENINHIWFQKRDRVKIQYHKGDISVGLKNAYGLYQMRGKGINIFPSNRI